MSTPDPKPAAYHIARARGADTDADAEDTRWTHRCKCGQFIAAGVDPTACDHDTDARRGRTEPDEPVTTARPASPAEALDREGTLYRTQGSHSNVVHRTADCRGIRSSTKAPKPIEHPAALPLRIDLCSEQDCWPEPEGES